MYRKLEESSANVLGYETRGKLTEEVLGVILADVEEATDRFGKINLLVSGRRYPGRTSAPSGRISSSPASTRST